MINEPVIKLGPSFDTKNLRATFQKKKRLHIPNILAHDSADLIYKSLSEDVDWHLIFNEGEKVHLLYPEQVKALTEAHHQQLKDLVYSKAQHQFQYYYYVYNIYDYYLGGKNMDHFLHRFHEFINTPEFLEFIQEISGMENIRFADSRATAYGPGHFLTLHHDNVQGERRFLAYVFNFTPEWNPIWGGALQFLGLGGHIEEGFVPNFNSLNIFEIPQDHAVSYVTPMALKTRYSINGWLRGADNPAT